MKPFILLSKFYLGVELVWAEFVWSEMWWPSWLCAEFVMDRVCHGTRCPGIPETGSMTGILEELKWETVQKRRKDSRLILLYKVLKGKARIPTVDLILKTVVVEINTQWPFIFLLLVKTPIRKTSFPKLSGTEMSSLILSSPLLNCRTTACINSLPW